jgi:acyl-CoA thioesterase
MSEQLQQATAVARVGDGVYTASIAADWDIGGNANGGYLLALAARAMVDATGRPPLSVTAHFVAPGRPGSCTVDVDVLRAGRRTATAAARLQGVDGSAVIALIGTFGDQQPGGPAVVDGAPPELPPYDECIPMEPPAAGSGFGQRVGVRQHPDDIGFALGAPSGRAEVRGWFRYRAEPSATEPFDEFDLLLATDSFAPVCFNRPEFPVGWAPTLELTVHIRGVPVPGALRCAFRSRFLQDGMFEEDGEIWDAAGRLVAQSRQLALIPRQAG